MNSGYQGDIRKNGIQNRQFVPEQKYTTGVTGTEIQKKPLKPKGL
jgi:hypothetical protein